MRDAIERARLERRIAAVVLLAMGVMGVLIAWFRNGGP